MVRQGVQSLALSRLFRLGLNLDGCGGLGFCHGELGLAYAV